MNKKIIFLMVAVFGISTAILSMPRALAVEAGEKPMADCVAAGDDKLKTSVSSSEDEEETSKKKPKITPADSAE